MKNIGKPYAGKLHVRFDEGGQVMSTKVQLLRCRQAKGAATDALRPKVGGGCSLLLPGAPLAANGFYRQFTDDPVVTAPAAALPQMGGSGGARDLRVYTL